MVFTTTCENILISRMEIKMLYRVIDFDVANAASFLDIEEMSRDLLSSIGGYKIFVVGRDANS